MIKFPYDEKRALFPDIQRFFAEEHGETIGDLAAERMLDFFLRRVGPRIFNQAIEEARQFVHRRFEDVESEFYGLAMLPPEEERDAGRANARPPAAGMREVPPPEGRDRPRYLLPDGEDGPHVPPPPPRPRRPPAPKR